MPEVVGLRTQIVSALKRYGPSAIPIEFLAKLVTRHPSEIEEPLRDLERGKIIMLEGEKVKLR